jgi:Glycosyl transferase family group 2
VRQPVTIPISDCAANVAAAKAIQPGSTAQSDMGIVTGWRTEIHPNRNVYHAMAEVEWHRPAGEIRSCGGDMMVRTTAFQATGGFNPRIICAEDEEFCLRMQDHGLRVHRLPQIMTRHDADTNLFGQWWRRTVRAGHGFAEVGGMQPTHYLAERRRVWVYGGVFPVVLVAGLVTGRWLLVGVAMAAYLFNWWRSMQGLRHNGQTTGQAAHQAVFLTLSKIANMQGMLTYYLRRWRGVDMQIIEYK